jgi:hypothetical protein
VAARCSETLIAAYTRLHGVEGGTVAQAVIRQYFTAEARIRQSKWVFALGQVFHPVLGLSAAVSDIPPIPYIHSHATDAI